MIWFYAWCAFIAFIILSVPLAAVLEQRALAGPSAGGGRKSKGDDESAAGDVEEAELSEEAEFAEEAEPAEGAEFPEEAELADEDVPMADDFGDPFEDFDQQK